MQWWNPNIGSWERINFMFFLKRLEKAMGFDMIKKITIKRYKRKKVKAEITEAKMYKIEFNLIVQDNANPLIIGPMNIEIPSRALYFAKKQLLQYIQHNIEVQVLDYKIKDDGDDDN